MFSYLIECPILKTKLESNLSVQLSSMPVMEEVREICSHLGLRLLGGLLVVLDPTSITQRKKIS